MSNILRKIIPALICIASALQSSAQIITTIAGTTIVNGFSGDGGPATAAKLDFVNNVTSDNSGNIYISDGYNYRVRKVDAAGIITTLAGSGNAPGYSGDGGVATAAEMNVITSTAPDNLGNLFICDGQNHCIRKVDAAGIITTVAGNGTAGFTGDGGPASTATLNLPFGIAADRFGNLYISDGGNNRIRKVDAAGIISTIAGSDSVGFLGDNGPASAARLNSPGRMSTDTAGNLFFVDILNYRIRKINTSGIITTVAGNGINANTGNGGPATAASLSLATCVATDNAGNLFLTDWGCNCVKKITGGIITTIAGTGGNGSEGDGGLATNARLNHPASVAVENNNNVVIGDWGNYTVRRIWNTPAAINSPVSAREISINPNPAHNALFISTGNTYADYSIVNTLGQEVKTQQITGKDMVVNIDDLQPGIYFIVFNGAGNKAVKKFVKSAN
jgi:hypothetical protein